MELIEGIVTSLIMRLIRRMCSPLEDGKFLLQLCNFSLTCGVGDSNFKFLS